MLTIFERIVAAVVGIAFVFALTFASNSVKFAESEQAKRDAERSAAVREVR